MPVLRTWLWGPHAVLRLDWVGRVSCAAALLQVACYPLGDEYGALFKLRSQPACFVSFQRPDVAADRVSECA